MILGGGNMTVPRQAVHVDSPTERRNPRTTDLDLLSTLDLLRSINAEDRLGPDAGGAGLPPPRPPPPSHDRPGPAVRVAPPAIDQRRAPAGPRRGGGRVARARPRRR